MWYRHRPYKTEIVWFKSNPYHQENIFCKGVSNMEKSPLKAIRQHCLDCCCGSAYEVKNCTIHDCELYPFRMRHNPNRKSSLSNEQRKEVGEKLKSSRLAKKSISET